MGNECDPRRYLTDDRDLPTDKRNELVIFAGGNGDWYVGVMREGTYDMNAFVRICTSGGAAAAAPGLPLALARAYRAMPPPDPEVPRG